jgi:hypothetical protein
MRLSRFTTGPGQVTPTMVEEHAARVLVQAFKRLPPEAVLPAAMISVLDRAEQECVRLPYDVG